LISLIFRRVEQYANGHPEANFYHVFLRWGTDGKRLVRYSFS